MTDYNKMLIDLLNEKVERLERDKANLIKENSTLKRELSKLKKQIKS
jgi:cell division protein FtsB